MIIQKVDALRKQLKNEKSIGFVPTMGFLHEGHLSLIREAKNNNECVVVSIFVNPTQFAPNEDFESYPRDLDRDYELAISAGADIVFCPFVEEVYGKGASTIVAVEGDITKKLCGKSRPSHFQGVTQVVTILFNMVKPQRAYFGQKDAQQSLIIKKMVRDLHMDIDIVICPIVREADGLAMSSRNVYLSVEERKQALILNQALIAAEEAVTSHILDPIKIKELIVNTIKTKPLAQIDYVDILSGFDLSECKKIKEVAESDQEYVLAAVAVKFGKTRLIDNRIINLKK